LFATLSINYKNYNRNLYCIVNYLNLMRLNLIELARY